MRALIFVSLVLPLTSVSAEDVDANRPGRELEWSDETDAIPIIVRSSLATN
jgi:hypothetical protein